MTRYILVDRAGKEIGAGYAKCVAEFQTLCNRDGTERTFKLWDLARMQCPDVEDEDPTAVYWEGAA